MWVRRPGHGRPIPILALSCEESLLFPPHPSARNAKRAANVGSLRRRRDIHMLPVLVSLDPEQLVYRSRSESVAGGGGCALRDYSCT